MKKLKEYINQIRGVSYKSIDSSNEPKKGYIPLLRANNINNGKINFDNIIYVKEEKVKSIQYLKKGDILTCTSSGSKELVGKAGLIKENYNATFGAFCKVIRVKEGCDYNYFNYFFQSNYYKKMIQKSSNGANINNLKTENFDNLNVNVFEIHLQRKIANKLDKVQEIINIRKKQMEQLDELIKSQFVEMFGDIQEYKKLEEYSTLITKGASPKWQGIDYKSNGTLFVTSENVREGYIDISKPKYLDNKINEILPRSVLKKDDILINIVGASIGRAGKYDYDYVANINQAVALVRTKNINNVFLLQYLNSEQAIRMYNDMKKGGARENLSLKNISDLKIPKAPIDLQNKFADFVKQVDKQKFELQKSLEEMQNLQESLMNKYFG